MQSSKVSRHISFSNEVLFIDGSWGTGKSILGPVLGAFDDVEKQKLDHIFEFVSNIHYFGEISEGAAISLIKTYADLDTFDSLMSREVNLRPSDDSGILNNPKALQYLKRLFVNGGNEIAQKIENEKPIMQIMSHHILPVADILFKALGKRLKVVEMFRHPAFMFDHWNSYLHRCGKDKREFTTWIKYNNEHLPWFVSGWEEEFLSLNETEKVIKSINHTYNLTIKSLDRFKDNHVLEISFENFVINPFRDLEKISNFLNKEFKESTMKKVLKRQKVPRKSLLAGRGHRGYGFQKADNSFNDKVFIREKVEKLKNEISIDLYDEFINTCVSYEERFNLSYLKEFYAKD